MRGVTRYLGGLPRPVRLILLSSSLFYVFGIWWGLPSFSGWAVDELMPSGVLEGIDQRFSGGWRYKYPPFHFFLLTVFYTPALVLRALGALDLNALPAYTTLAFVGRFVSVCMALGLLVVVYRCGRELYEERAAVFATFIAAFTMPFTYYAKIANMEVPYLFWFMLSMLGYLRVLKRHELRDYLLLTISAALCIATKDHAAFLFIPMPVILVVEHYRQVRRLNPRAGLTTTLLGRKLLWSFAVGLAVLLLADNVVFNWEGTVGRFRSAMGGTAIIRPRFDNTVAGHLAMLVQSVRHLRFALGWPLFVVCLLGLWTCRLDRGRCGPVGWLWLPLAAYYLLFVSSVRYNDVRYLLSFALVLAFYGGRFLSDVAGGGGRFAVARRVLVAVVCLHAVWYAGSVNLLMAADSRYGVERWRKEHVSPDARVYGAGDTKFLPRLDGYRATVTKRPVSRWVNKWRPEYIIMTPVHDQRAFTAGSPECMFFDRLESGELGYELVLRRWVRPMASLIDQEELMRYEHIMRRRIHSNFDKLSPEIRVYRRKNV